MEITAKLVSEVSLILSGVFAALAVFLFFYFKILTIINDLSGKTARKSIEEIRRKSELSSAKMDTGKIAKEHAPATGNKAKSTSAGQTVSQKIQVNKAEEVKATEVLSEGALETDILTTTGILDEDIAYSNEEQAATSVLVEKEELAATSILVEKEELLETGILVENLIPEEKVDLDETGILVENHGENVGTIIELLEEIMIIHTSETI